MPISDDEAVRLINHIESTVREVASVPNMQGIAGLVDQWRADVEAGRTIERKVSVRPSPGVDEPTETLRLRSTTSGDFVGKEDYTVLEQLDMLVVSLCLAFLAPSMMSERLLDTIAQYSREHDRQEPPDPVIDFLGVETTDATRTISVISRDTIVQSKKATAELVALSKEIIQEANLDPRKLIEGEDVA